MSRWRDHKRAAARALHATMGVPAVYLTTLDGAPLRVEVRVHTDIQAVDFGRAAFDEAFSSFVDDTPKLIFDQSEVESPLSRSWVVVGPEEMYRIGPSRPPKSGQIAVEVTPLTATEKTAALAVFAPDWPDVSALDAAWEGIL